MNTMSWHKIVIPLTTEIDPDVVQIGKLGWACYEGWIAGELSGQAG